MKIENLIKSILIFFFIIALSVQYNIGLADNGDFTRSMKWITSGPVEIEPNWPSYGTEEWARRFFNYWIPFWKLEWQWTEIVTRPISSALFLWVPSAILNYFFYSPKILYLPILSTSSKLILLTIFLLLFKWSESYTKYSKILLISFVGPIIFMFTTTDYLSYLNSFYLESASLVYIVLFFASILVLQKRSTMTCLISAVMSLFLLATTKPAYIYWPLVAVPFILYAWQRKKNTKKFAVVLINLLVISIFTVASIFITKTGSIQANSYHSLFYGVLTFSNNPVNHLQELGINNAEPCLNIPAYSSIGTVCFNEYQNQMSFKNTVVVIYKEPLVLLKSLKYVFDNMQIISLDYLGKYSFDDPRSKMSHSTSDISKYNLLNLWSKLKLRFFPKGYMLGFVLCGFILWFALNLKKHADNINKDLAFVGLMLTIACIVDMVVAILGDGKYELIKHLFLANIIFDLVLIIFINSVFIHLVDIGRNLLQSNDGNLGTPNLLKF